MDCASKELEYKESEVILYNAIQTLYQCLDYAEQMYSKYQITEQSIGRKWSAI